MPLETITPKQQLLDISKKINRKNYNEAIQYLAELEFKYPENEIISFAKVGILIDAGFGLKKDDIIKNGIILGDRLIKDFVSDKQKIIHLHYNIANGYLDLFALSIKDKIYPENIPDNEYLQKAKFHFRESIKNIVKKDDNLELQLWTNYGNCLDRLGRSLEALYSYEKAININPFFSMALGNKAKAMMFFADISGDYRTAIYIESYKLLKLTVKQDNVVQFGGIFAKENFEREILKIESRVKDKNLLNKNVAHNKYDDSMMSDFEKYYYAFCSNHSLFLNTHIHADYCSASIKDPVFIRLITPLEDNKTFPKLAKQINQIKEDFAVARLLLVQSQYKRDDFNRISKRTLYANLSDYSLFNLYIGLLKTAFREAYNILDKIASFINEYYKIGFHSKHLYFDTTVFWQKEGKIRERFLNSKNISLYALYDIFLDFNNGYYKNIKDHRNALTHRKLVIYDNHSIPPKQVGDSSIIEYGAFYSETVSLFQLLKAASIYLINCVEIEQRRIEKNQNNKILTIIIDDYQFLKE